ncbi:putative EKC/KEOPS complex subunit PCC1/LAGE3 [Paratrimastix pyriformis]|uniref:EKC/KEOPS complex subunit PCC1/LAGE3 n=1 Tax=Paratrimastix pyriformis TaxID=342808 RepID=A0ABQ8UUU7_9EUKA|nr:putative EKC/KEOPS complex subunit PCC1/LAGE3 [Paratrimastix pyriformis]
MASQRTEEPMPMDHECTLRIKYDTTEQAHMVLRALSVDRELAPERANKELRVEGNFLVAHFKAVEFRLLRTTLSAFTEMVLLANRTFDLATDKLIQELQDEEHRPTAATATPQQKPRM